MIRILQLFTVGLLLGATTLWAPDFKHDAHLTMAGDPPCITCHTPDAPGIDPGKKVCLECHDQAFIDTVKFPGLLTHDVTWALTHRTAAVTKSIDCSACHEQSYCLDCHKAGRVDEMGNLGNTMTNVHRSEFSVTHPLAARSNPQLCSSCHESRFCSDCHSDFRAGPASGPSHRRSFGLSNGGNLSIEGIHAGMSQGTNCDVCHTQGSVSTNIHDWQVGHARDARKNLQTCQSCHPGGDTCLKCHSAKSGVVGFNPHGKNWLDRAGRLQDASNNRTCRKCH